MSDAQLRARVDWPLALPVAFAGVRTATVEVIASASLAGFIGGGGLGEYIINALASNDVPQLIEGALGVAALALLADAVLALVESRLNVTAGGSRRALQERPT